MKNRTKNHTDANNAIELAILNGIERFRREQAEKSTPTPNDGNSPVKNQNTAVNPQNTANNLKNTSVKSPNTAQPNGAKRPSPQTPKRAKGKGKGTPIAASFKREEGEKLMEAAPPQETIQENKHTAGKRNMKRQPQPVLSESAKDKVPALGTEDKKAGKRRGKKKPTVKILFFGGVGEIGKNMTAIEYENDIIVIDAGIIFPTEEMPGVDLVFPDITYLSSNREKVRAVFLTHGHEDHIGGVPYLMKELNAGTPVYGTKLTLALTDNKLREHRMNNVRLMTVSPKEKVKAGVFTVNFVNVNHSIAGALALAVETPCGVIFHSGDFKIDLTPVAGSPIDLAEIAEWGKKGVLLYLGESTNIERPGYTMSETVVGETLEHLFSENASRRIIIATFASNVHRLQQIIDIAVKFKRKVALSGRSMLNVADAAIKIGELSIPEGVLVDVEKVKNFYDHEIVIVSTGSQGEPMSALTRMASGEFGKIAVGANDTIIISASPIPGNERMIYRVINNLFKLGASVIYESLEKIHVSGHACQEEHKIMHTLLKPKFFIPVHGEYRHLKRHAMLAEELGMPSSHIFIPSIGTLVEVTEDSLTEGESFPAGARLIDGEDFEDLGTSEALKDRLKMSSEGVFLISVGVSGSRIVLEPTFESRGMVCGLESDSLRDLSELVTKTIEGVGRGGDLCAAVKRAVKNYFFKKTKQSPMIIPIIREL